MTGRGVAGRGGEFDPASRPSRCLAALRALGGEPATTGQVTGVVNAAGSPELTVHQVSIALRGLTLRRPPPVRLVCGGHRGTGQQSTWQLTTPAASERDGGRGVRGPRSKPSRPRTRRVAWRGTA